MSLVVGCTGVGKTLLLKRLQAFNHLPPNASKSSLSALAANVVSPTSPSSPNSDSSNATLPEVPPTQPTTGTNLVTVKLGKRQDVTLREMGGAMAPIWKNYLKDCESLIYVVDMSARALTAASCIQILELLNADDLAKKPVLLLLNKIDAPSRMTRGFFANVTRLGGIVSHANQPITILEASAATGEGLKAVHQWLMEHHCR